MTRGVNARGLAIVCGPDQYAFSALNNCVACSIPVSLDRFLKSVATNCAGTDSRQLALRLGCGFASLFFFFQAEDGIRDPSRALQRRQRVRSSGVRPTT